MTELPRTTLGSTTISIARFIFGAGGLGGIAGETGAGIGASDEEARLLLDHALDIGIDLIDTADIYAKGASERILGRWLAAESRPDVLVQTKTGYTADGPNLSPRRLRDQLEHSRKILGRVDLFLPHTVDPDTPWADSLPVLSEAVDAGTIRAYGLSNVTEPDLIKAIETADRLGIRRPSLIQNQYSLIARTDDGGVLPIVRSESMGYTPYSPLATGLLTGRYSNGEQPAHGSRASIASRAAAQLNDDQIMARIRRFDRVARDSGSTSAALALAWLLNHPGVTAPIIGPSKPAQWDAITDAATIAWTDSLAQAVDEAFAD